MKKIIIILSIFLLTGCQVKYNITFNDDKIKENISVIIPKDSYEIDELKSLRPYSINMFNTKALYKINHKEHFKTFEANYSYEFNTNNYLLASQPARCFKAFSFAKTNDGYILSTSKGFKCMELNYHEVDNVQIEIKTNRIVLQNNADIYKNDKYIWNITNDNANEKNIIIQFGEVKEKKWFEKIIDFIKKNLIEIIIITVLLSSILIPTFVLINKAKKNNDI